MEAIEAASEQDDAAPNFLQKAQVKVEPTPEFDADGKRAAIINLLRTESKALKSTLLASLVSQVEADPFAKLKKLIQELIERLLQEAADEANHKGWCDKETSAAKQDRTYNAEEIEQLNGRLASNEALRDKLQEEVDILEKEIKELEDELAKATKLRKDEKAENLATIKEAEEGQDAVEMAIEVLSKFYNKAKDAKVEFTQAIPDMPDSGFESGEAYKGKQAASGGILGMLDVILGDFERTIRETTKEEAKAAQEFLEFDRTTKTSINTKKLAREAKDEELQKVLNEIADDMASLISTQ